MPHELRYSPQARAERLIASGRALISVVSLLWVLFASAGAAYERITVTVLTIYAAYAAIFAILAWSSPGPALERRVVTHVFDVGVLCILLVLTREPGGPSLLFFFFVLLSASLRFHRRGVLLTALAAVIVYLSDAVPQIQSLGALEVLLRASVLALSGGLAYSLGSYEEEVRDELLRAGSWPRSMPANSADLSEQLLRQASRVLRAPRILMSWIDDAEPWLYIEQLSGRGFESVRESPVRYDPLIEPSLYAQNFIAVSQDENSAPLVILHERNRFPERRLRALHHDFARQFDLRTFVSTRIPADTVDCRLFVPFNSPPTTDVLLLAEVVADLLAVRIDQYNISQDKEQAMLDHERLRLYRDLHDGLLQSMNGVFLQLEAVHSLIGSDPDEARKRLTQAQSVVLGDQRELRSFIERLRPSSWKPQERSQIEPLLIELAERYQQEWGMKVDVRVEVAAPLTPSLNNELYSLANEALANAAKHAGASHLRLDLEARPEGVRMSIRYDGAQFPFRGRYDLTELNRMNAGSLTLRERVGWLQGNMTIESNDRGSELQIQIPLRPIGEPA
jgi:signal transduction histidine kinase